MSDLQPQVPRPLASAAAYAWRGIVVLAAAYLALKAIGQLTVVLVPLVLACFIGALLEPLAARLRRRGLPPVLAATVVFLGFLAIFVGALVWIGNSVVNELDDVGEQVRAGVEEAKRLLARPPFNLDEQRLNELVDRVRASAGGGSGVARRVAGPARAAGEVVSGIVLTLFTLFFILKDGERIGAWTRARVPRGYLEDLVVFSSRTREVMKQYMVATALTGLIDGILIGIALVLVGVPLALPLAVLTFVGGFFPIVGAFSAGLVATLVALVSGGPTDALLILAATVAVQQIEGNLLQPLVMERAIALHPLVTTLGVAAGLIVGGLVGGFLAVPLIAIAARVVSFYRFRHEPGGVPPPFSVAPGGHEPPSAERGGQGPRTDPHEERAPADAPAVDGGGAAPAS